MQLVIQRVRSAQVSVDEKVVARIEKGLVVLVGFGANEAPDSIEEMARRVVSLRIFDDDAGRMNYSIRDIKGGILLVPQVTLTADIETGNRPSFHTAAPIKEASELFEQFAQALKAKTSNVSTGVFRTHMVVALENDGPVTFVLDSDKSG